MQSLSDALNRFHEDVSWFARAQEIKLLVVRTPGDLRSTIVKLLPMLEFHADNFSPWVLVEDDGSPADEGWALRTNRVLADWERRREAFAEEGVTLAAPHLPAVHDGAGRVDHGRGQFAATLRALLDVVAPPLRGYVCILAPTVVSPAGALDNELEQLTLAPALAGVRWVYLLDVDAPLPERLLQTLGPRALVSDCSIDPAQQEKDLDAMLVPGAPLGRAGPRGVTPPKRVDDPPELPLEVRDAALREAGIEPAFLEEAPVLQRLVLGAAVAMKRGAGPEAVRLQREAKDLCARLGMQPVRVICQIALASYLSGLGESRLALRELDEAIAVAVDHGLAQAESQAHLARGLLLALARQLPEAARAYVAAAQAAHRAAIPPLEIEAWRMAGQLALQIGLEQEAVASFREAIRVASETPPDVVKVSSATEAARRLAVVCRERGLAAQATSLDEQADAMERGEFGMAPVPPTALAAEA